MDGVRIALLVWCLMKKLVCSLLLMLAVTSISSACDWYPGKLIAERRAARQSRSAPTYSAPAPTAYTTAAVAAPSVPIQVYHSGNFPRAMSAVRTLVAPRTCTGPNCPK